MQKRISTLAGILIILAAAVVLVGGAWAYLQYAKSQTPMTNVQQNTETAGWKTYKNDKYGFEVKYPSSFKTDSSLPTEYASDGIWLLNSNEQINQLTISGKVRQNISFADYKIDYDNKKFDCGGRHCSILEIPAIPETKSVTFIEYSNTPGVWDIYVTTLIQKDSKTIIELSLHGFNDNNMVNLHKQIVSTFTFTK